MRDAQSFYDDFSIYPSSRVESATRPRRASESHPSSSNSMTLLTDFLQNSPPALPVQDVIHIPNSQFSLGFFCESNGNEGVLRIPQSSSKTGTSPSDCLVSYPGHSWGGSYPSAEKQSMYSTAPADWAQRKKVDYKKRNI